jgi:hypothetical protein
MEELSAYVMSHLSEEMHSTPDMQAQAYAWDLALTFPKLLECLPSYRCIFRLSPNFTDYSQQWQIEDGPNLFFFFFFFLNQFINRGTCPRQRPVVHKNKY